MVDSYNVWTYNSNTGFKTSYLNKLERMLEKVLPHAMLKAKSNLESRIRTLKRDWAIIYEHRQILLKK
ncbi:hypothetical protein Goarm_003307 [Gossypium armourianum]|uniref:Uncharacterized protein n=1 Tax=Gossypium armourianum TaxID=34283 RepID=A0A7J9K2T1_9ROSI|nr:hypothetical protein [Gossypium armourianum]